MFVVDEVTAEAIRRAWHEGGELDRFFTTLPSVADGFQIRTWRGGPQAGQPKVPHVAKGLLERGLMHLQPTPWPPRLFFTEAGLAALRTMMANTRFVNPRQGSISVQQPVLRTRAVIRRKSPS